MAENLASPRERHITVEITTLFSEACFWGCTGFGVGSTKIN
jgi:hypothetical protein